MYTKNPKLRKKLVKKTNKSYEYITSITDDGREPNTQILDREHDFSLNSLYDDRGKFHSLFLGSKMYTNY